MGLKQLFWRRNPLDELLKKAKQNKQSKFLIVWNRGLGDIALGLYGLNLRIRMFIPQAEITYLTREDLKEGFKLLPRTHVVVDPIMKRGTSVDLKESLNRAGKNQKDFDVIIEEADPTRWLKWQLGRVVPKLSYQEEWDALAQRYPLEGKEYIGVHIDTETGQYYRYQKNWPKESWMKLFEKERRPFIVFGNQKQGSFPFPHVVDLRGDTSLPEMLSIIKNHCRFLVVPDSGVLSIVYYVRSHFPIDIISLWADPNQGVLKHGVRSPNRLLTHVPLIKKGKIENISVEIVQSYLGRNIYS